MYRSTYMFISIYTYKYIYKHKYIHKYLVSASIDTSKYLCLHMFQKNYLELQSRYILRMYIITVIRYFLKHPCQFCKLFLHTLHTFFLIMKE